MLNPNSPVIKVLAKKKHEQQLSRRIRARAELYFRMLIPRFLIPTTPPSARSDVDGFALGV